MLKLNRSTRRRTLELLEERRMLAASYVDDGIAYLAWGNEISRLDLADRQWLRPVWLRAPTRAPVNHFAVHEAGIFANFNVSDPVLRFDPQTGEPTGSFDVREQLDKFDLDTDVPNLSTPQIVTGSHLIDVDTLEITRHESGCRRAWSAEVAAEIDTVFALRSDRRIGVRTYRGGLATACAETAAFGDNIHDFWVSPRGDRLLTNRGEVFSLENFQRLDAFGKDVRDVAFLPEQTVVLQPGQLVVYDSSWQLLGASEVANAVENIFVHEDTVFAVSRELESFEFATFSLSELLESRDQALQVGDITSPQATAVSSRDTLLLLSEDDTLHEWDPNSHRFVAQFPLGMHVSEITYDVTNDWLYLASERRIFRLDLQGLNTTPELVTELSDAVRSLSVGNDRIIASTDRQIVLMHPSGIQLDSVNRSSAGGLMWNGQVDRLFFGTPRLGSLELSEGVSGLEFSQERTGRISTNHDYSVTPNGVLGVTSEGVAFNARTLEELPRTLPFPVVDLAFSDDQTLLTIDEYRSRTRVAKWAGGRLSEERTVSVPGKPVALNVLGDGRAVVVTLVQDTPRFFVFDVASMNLANLTTPTAYFEGGIVAVGQALRLDGSESADPEDGPGLLAFSWSAEGPGPVNWTGAQNTISEFRADVPGEYTVTLSVSDGANVATFADTVTVRSNEPPVADFSNSDTFGNASRRPAVLRSNRSTDADGDRLSTAWQLIDSPDGAQASIQRLDSDRAHLFADIPGTYTVQGEVTDGYISTIATHEVTFRENRPPTLVRQEIPLRVTGSLDTIFFDATQSFDPDGDPLTFRWEWLGSSIRSIRNQNSAYAYMDVGEGSHFVRLTVTDGDESVSEDFYFFVEPDRNLPPVATVNGSDYAFPLIGSTIQLDATQSYDPNGDALTFAWTSPDNVVISDPHAARTTLTAERADRAARVILTVSDGQHESTISHFVFSRGNNAPRARVLVSEGSIRVGKPVTVKGSHSFDPDGDELSYYWTTNSDRLVITDPRAPVTSVLMTGFERFPHVTLTVADGVTSHSESMFLNAESRSPTVANAADSAMVGLSGELLELTANGTNFGSHSAEYLWRVIGGSSSRWPRISSPREFNTTLVGQQPGLYLVELLVTTAIDFDTDIIAVEIRDSEQPHFSDDELLLASALRTPTRAPAGQPVPLDASESVVPRGMGATYQWRLAASSVAEPTVISQSDEPFARWTPSVPGHYLLELEVTKDQQVARDHVLIHVEENVVARALSSFNADLTGDRFVDFQDFLILAGAFGESTALDPLAAIADLDRDGSVDFADFLLLSKEFGRRLDNPLPLPTPTASPGSDPSQGIFSVASDSESRSDQEAGR